MYKNGEKRKEASKERMRRMRQGVTSTEGVTEPSRVEGVTKVKGVTIPESARVLPALTVGRVRAVLQERARLGLFDDSSDRWQRAATGYDWDKRGRPVEG